MGLLIDTFLKMYLWSHIEPATAIWCACLMTYGPLFAEIGLRLRSVFGGSKQTTSNKKKLSHSKTSNNITGSDSDSWPSLGLNLRGAESAGYRELSARAANGKVHVVNVSIKPCPPDRRASFPADEYECSRIAVGRDASLV